VRYKAQVCDRFIFGIANSNSSEATDICLVFVCVVWVEVFATGRSLIQGNPTESLCLTVCDQEQQLHSAPTGGVQKRFV
jgi:hypothetical protein